MGSPTTRVSTVETTACHTVNHTTPASSNGPVAVLGRCSEVIRMVISG